MGKGGRRPAVAGSGGAAFTAQAAQAPRDSFASVDMVEERTYGRDATSRYTGSVQAARQY